MNLYIHFLIKSASCLLAATTLIMASSCTWLEGDLLDLSGGEPSTGSARTGITIPQ